ncbi:MAG: hypothetical protein HY875_15315 [Chloroflexi bacterium]|nr:hypothetical protein [Chloroflexota bacterium]
MKPTLLVWLAAVASLPLLASCTGDTPKVADAVNASAPEPAAQPTRLTVALSEWDVKPDQARIPAGGLTMIATNEGAQLHDLVIVRTEVEVMALPVAGGTVDESKITIIGRFREFKSGEKEKQFALAAGRYLLICNLPGHYQLGMVTPLSVE